MRDRHVPVQRMFALRQYPGFANADLSELAALADNVVETTYVPGALVARAGRVPPFNLVLEGRIALDGRVGTSEVAWGPRDLAGAIEAMGGRALETPMIATMETRTLQLGAADFADILEDNFGLLSNVQRELARYLLAFQRRRRNRPDRDAPVVVVGSASPGLVERLVALRRQMPLGNARIQALAALARATTERTVAAGEIVARAGESAKSLFLVLDGAVRDGKRVLGPDGAIGSLEVLAATPHVETAEAITPARLLEVPAIALFDVIEDHTDLGLAMVASLASAIFDELHRRTETDDPVN